VGVELSANLKPAPWLRAEVGYAYLWTRDDTNARPLDGRPPHTAHAAIRADLPWSVELTARYRIVTDAFLDNEGLPIEILDQFCPEAAGLDEDDPARDGCPLLRTRPFQTLDMRIARPLWPSSQIYVGVKNLLDVQKDPVHLRGIGDRRPLEGRIIYFGIIAELPWEEEP
jgi:outer membrane receptor for ferrienterochelin and colicins